ncbi:MAG: endopeptidase La [Epsilonproteobacteria bacterium]|nr:endopeptidase La [Campylobacterota bacterium]
MDSSKNAYFGVEDIPTIIPVIPTIDVVVFPHMVVPLLILDEKIIKGVEHTLASSKKVLLLAAQQQTSGYHGPIGIQDLYKVGTVGNIMRVMNLPEGGIKVLVQGICKAKTEEIISDQDFLQAQITVNQQEEITPETMPEIEASIKNIFSSIEKITATGKMFSPDFQAILSQIQDSTKIADFILSHLNLNVGEAQVLLEKESFKDLLNGINEHLQREFDLNHMQERIRNNTRESINKSQREYYLREQLKAIQKELGEEGDADTEDLKRKLFSLPLPQEAKVEAQRQVKRLEKTAPDSMEATVIRNHLDWILSMPWGKLTQDNNDIARAKEILDHHHHGLSDVKERILDFLSVRFLKQDCNAPILCLVGPPGVGKTSLGSSIAECLGRKYFRISLGGVYDESEIRGHRRTYVGALPGRFIQAIRKSESCNPVIIIDEIDKIGMSNRGDPSSALLEVLDPEQNGSFYDNYLGIHFDLSKVMFIATANDASTIPGPLRDRMEVITLAGYTHDEKLEIAQRHLVNKALTNTGLTDRGFTIDADIINSIITNYTQEAGVRDLARNIQKLCSKFARSLVEKKEQLAFTKDNLEIYLGPCKNRTEEFMKNNRIGVTNGLAWTPYGGQILRVEAILMKGSGKLLLTGQLGDVLKESAQAAITYARAHADEFGIDKAVFDTCDLHIHLPAGGTPKDGPSAGISLLSSILSAYTKRAIKGDFAMTGELNLQGEVLPIGGLKEKILAAKQNGVHNIIVPKLNEKDMTGLEKLQEGLKIIFVKHVQEVLDQVLIPIEPGE